jgi:catechol 2,3-dioxygenase-like lactoylglutathione lyase family enzyme
MLKLSHATVFTIDQDSAKAFYMDKLGFELRNDIVMGEGFEGAGGGFRWLTVSSKDQPEAELILASTEMGRDPESAEQLRKLVASGAIGIGVLTTDDCRRTYEELKGKGVTFLQEPAERPYGIEAVFRDDSGNVWSLTQPVST